MNRRNIMYIWFAVDVDEQAYEIRANAENYAKKMTLYSPTLTLPFHISLKISFQVPDDKVDEIIVCLENYFSTISPFEIKVREIEKSGNIIWLVMEENEILNCIHNDLDKILLDKFGVIQHKFDKTFIFHISILIFDNKKQADGAFAELKNTDLPKIFDAKKIVIGTSPNGKPGTYKVIKEIII